MDPFLSDRRARWHPVDTLCFPYVATSPPPASLHHHEIPNTPPTYPNPAGAGFGAGSLRPLAGPPVEDFVLCLVLMENLRMLRYCLVFVNLRMLNQLCLESLRMLAHIFLSLSDLL